MSDPPAETATAPEQGENEPSLLDKIEAYVTSWAGGPPYRQPTDTRPTVMACVLLIGRLAQVLRGERAAYEQLQARLSMLTALVGEVANSLGETLLALCHSDFVQSDDDECFADIATSLASTLAQTFQQMGVDPESLAEATGIVLPDEGE